MSRWVPATVLLTGLLISALACNLPLSIEGEEGIARTATTSESGLTEDDQSAAACPADRLDPFTLPALREVTHWLYLIDTDLDPETVDHILTSAYDMVVVDFIPSEKGNTDYPMTDVVARLHCAETPKLVLAYIDIAQAEDFRTYWQSGWTVGDPEWITGDDPDGWEGDYPVAFWHDEWQDIWLGDRGYLQAILAAGFDGVYLDWVEAFSDEDIVDAAERDGVDPRQKMIAWIGDIARATRALNSGFIVIAQNAAELVTSEEYVAIIDGIAQEHVWFDGGADDEPPGDCPLPRTDADVDTRAYQEGLSAACRHQYDDFPDGTLHVSSEWYLRQLERARQKGLVVLTVDYALDPDNVSWIHHTSRSFGFVPFVGRRALDQYVEPVR